MSGLIDLATHETKSLDFQEATIEKGRKTFVEVGKALAKIRDGKLYRETHTTFEAYCQERWGWNRDRAYKLIEGAEVSENVSKWIQTGPATESHPARWSQSGSGRLSRIWIL